MAISSVGRIRYMRPQFPIHNFVNRSPTNTKQRSNFPVRHFGVYPFHFADFSDGVFINFCSWAMATSAASAFANHVTHVFIVATQEQMVRPNTKVVVTVMQNPLI